MLQDFRTYLLVGQGEFFAEFITQASRALERSIVRATLHDARAAWGRAAGALGYEESPPFKLFNLTLHPTRTSSPGRDVDTNDGWAALGLDASLDWPLRLVFTPEVMVRICLRS